MKKTLLASLFLSVFAAGALADDEHDDEHNETFTILELADLTKQTVADLELINETLAKNVFAFTSQLAGEEAKIRLYSKDQLGVTTRVNFSCHRHDGITECHRQ
jgi:hypothetical protein